MARLREKYQVEVVPKLKERFQYRSQMQIPKLSKIVLNMGLGEAIQNIKILDSATEELAESAGKNR
jgi:large subunit ribosomal protein L5